jgi:hypothetical protein
VEDFADEESNDENKDVDEEYYINEENKIS